MKCRVIHAMNDGTLDVQFRDSDICTILRTRPHGTRRRRPCKRQRENRKQQVNESPTDATAAAAAATRPRLESSSVVGPN